MISLLLATESFDWGNFINITGPVGAMLVALAFGIIVPGKLYDQQRKDLERAYDQSTTQGVEVVKALTKSNELLSKVTILLDRVEHR